MTSILKEELDLADLDGGLVLRLMGIKRTNANSLGHLEADSKRGTALYPVYPLMNSNCFCNTAARISTDSDLVMTVRAQRDIAAGEEITTRYVNYVYLPACN